MVHELVGGGVVEYDSLRGMLDAVTLSRANRKQHEGLKRSDLECCEIFVLEGFERFQNLALNASEARFWPRASDFFSDSGLGVWVQRTGLA